MNINKKNLLIILLSLLLVSCSLKPNKAVSKANQNQIMYEWAIDDFKELLEDESCKFPDCFLGIIPNQSSLEDVQEILQENNLGEIKFSGFNRFVINWNIEKKGRKIEYRTMIFLTFDDENIVRILSTINENSSRIYFNDLLQNYFPIKVFESYGIPDYIFYNLSKSDNPSGLMKFIYNDQNFLYNFYSYQNSEEFCFPLVQEDIKRIDFILEKNVNLVDKYISDDGQENEKSEVIFRLNPEEFYNQIIKTNEYCFDLFKNE